MKYRYTPRISKKQQHAVDILYNVMEGKAIMNTKQGAASFASIQEQLPTIAELPFIGGSELEAYDRFTILSARKTTTQFGIQIYFDVAVKDGTDKIRKFTFGVSDNDERTALMDMVKRIGMITGVRLDFVSLKGGNRYMKFVDADSPRDKVYNQENLPTSTIDDSDIPF